MGGNVMCKERERKRQKHYNGMAAARIQAIDMLSLSWNPVTIFPYLCKSGSGLLLFTLVRQIMQQCWLVPRAVLGAGGAAPVPAGSAASSQLGGGRLGPVPPPGGRV